MVRIVSDSSTLYSTSQALDAGFSVSPLSVTIAGKTYREFDEIDSDTFVSIIREGNLPTSSQPAIGEVSAMYGTYPEDEILNISMAHGLSGTYTSAVAAANLDAKPERITVVNSRTLCGPHRYLVEKAVALAKAGYSREEILNAVNACMDTAKSFLIPADFAYLRRGGRLSPLVSYVGQMTHMAPIMTQTEDGTMLTLAGVRRNFAQAIKHVAKLLEKKNLDASWRIYITHGSARAMADEAHEILRKAFPDALFEVLPLSPAFITQGGPSCVAVQVIHI